MSLDAIPALTALLQSPSGGLIAAPYTPPPMQTLPAPLPLTTAGGSTGPTGNTFPLVPVTNPATGVTSYQPAASSPATAAAALPVAATAGLASIPLWGYALIAAGLLWALMRRRKEPT